MGLRQNLAYQPSFRIQIHPEWPQELVQLKEELWSSLLHKTWLWDGSVGLWMG